MNNQTDVNGNRDVIRLLESILETAKREPIGYVAVVACQEPAKFMGAFTGTVELERNALASMKDLEAKIEKNILNRTLPDPEPELDASYVCYNITEAPLSFDFVTWLIDAEMTRIRENAPGPLKVGFWFGRDGKTGMGGSSNREQMMQHVCIPALELIGGVEDPLATRGKFKNFFSYRDICKGFLDGEAVPKFKTDLVLTDVEDGYVTITLREAEYWPHRNSKLNEWIKFARWLEAQGERVIFVRDTAYADVPIEGFKTYPAASRDLKIRCALYQQAKCNLFVANGPISLAYFGDTPWLKFFEIDDDGAYNAARSDFWKQCVGVEVGGQFPWSNDKQRIVWQPDYFTNMVLAWRDLWKA